MVFSKKKKKNYFTQKCQNETYYFFFFFFFFNLYKKVFNLGNFELNFSRYNMNNFSIRNNKRKFFPNSMIILL